MEELRQELVNLTNKLFELAEEAGAKAEQTADSFAEAEFESERYAFKRSASLVLSLKNRVDRGEFNK